MPHIFQIINFKILCCKRNLKMLTPAFDLSQNDEFLIISIQMPYAKISEYNVQCEDYEFVFSCTPYYLRLCLPGKVQYCDSPKCVYDLDKKTFVMEVPKAVRGEEFKDLDLINLMLRSKKTTSVGVPKIEVLESTDDVEESEEELDIIIDQVPSEDKFGDLNISGQQCGFANSYTYSVFKLKDEAYEIFDITEPETKTRKIRTEERIQHEKKTFKEDHYIADLYEDVDIKRVLKFNPIWVSLFDEVQKNPSEDIIHFTPEEKNRLMDLPSKKYILYYK
ncbi:protein SHQ1 homolog [Caerostris darwini]|uniref:Protein SHQ1 homolog n=1 Tax=Caerostris darwini TaxID=1538125 RepID=A0AAV4PXR5_9ARAC|nr:protein SHQ1 homolog [Caerostris darwini]